MGANGFDQRRRRPSTPAGAFWFWWKDNESTIRVTIGVIVGGLLLLQLVVALARGELSFSTPDDPAQHDSWLVEEPIGD